MNLVRQIGNGWLQSGRNEQQQALDAGIYHHLASEQRDVLHNEAKTHGKPRVQGNLVAEHLAEKLRVSLALKFLRMTSGSGKQSIVSFGKERSFQVNKWALLKPLRTVDRGCAKLPRYSSIPTPPLCHSAASKAQEHLGENTSSISLNEYCHFISVYSADDCLLCGCKWAQFCDMGTGGFRYLIHT